MPCARQHTIAQWSLTWTRRLSRGTSQESGEIKITPETSGLWTWGLLYVCAASVHAGCRCSRGVTARHTDRRVVWLGWSCVFVLAVITKTWALYETISAISECLRSYKNLSFTVVFCLWSLPFCLFTARVQDRVIHPSSIFWVQASVNLGPCCRRNTAFLSYTCGEHHPPSSLPSCCFWSLSWFIWREGCVWLLGGPFNSAPSSHKKTRSSNF